MSTHEGRRKELEFSLSIIIMLLFFIGLSESRGSIHSGLIIAYFYCFHVLQELGQLQNVFPNISLDTVANSVKTHRR